MSEISGFDWTKWAATMASFVAGIVGGTWAARGELEKLKQKNIVQDMRLDAIEKDRESIESMAKNLAVLAALQNEMRDDIKEIFQRCNAHLSGGQTLYQQRLKKMEGKHGL